VLQTLALGVLGIMGVMLSITDIFGMAGYSVSKRLRELGIRVDRGAQPTEVLRAALGRAVKLLAFGSVVGMLLGILASSVLAFSCIRQVRAIRWCWQVSWLQCRCSGCWPPGFLRDGRCRSML
jgi:ABC-type antimicrobial peptide transport system permease subunit